MSEAAHASCHWPQVSSRTPPEAKSPGWTLTASIVASSLAFLDGSIVNVALPALGQGLHGDAMDLQWSINGYLLPLSALLLIGGAAGDNFGRRRLMIAGIVIFAVASIGCALAPTFGILVPMRALQGVGGALLMPNSLALLGAAFSGEARGRAIGTWAAAGVGASAAGPPLGGWLIEIAGWRSIFLINVPIAMVALAITWRHVAEVGDGDQALDWPGAALVTCALGLITTAVTLWSSQDTIAWHGWIALAGGLAAFTAFLVVEHRRGNRAMMPLAMFGAPAFVGLTLVTFFTYAALGGLFILFPYVLIEGGYTPLQAGLGLLPFSVITGLASRPMGQLASRLGPRWPLVGGSLIGAAGYALLGLVDPSGSYWMTVVPGAATVAVGTAGVVAPLTTAVLASVDSHHTGTASGFNSAIARTGGLIATAFCGIVLTAHSAALIASFHAATLAGVALALASALIAFVSLGSKTARLSAG